LEQQEANGKFDEEAIAQGNHVRPIPIRNSEGEITDYAFNLSKKDLEKLRVSTPAHKIMGDMTGKAVTANHKTAINQDIVNSLFDDYAQASDLEKKLFIKVRSFNDVKEPTALQKDLTRLWNMIPEDIRNELRADNEDPYIPIRRQLILNTFGVNNIDMVSRISNLSRASTKYRDKVFKGIIPGGTPELPRNQATIDLMNGTRIAATVYQGLVSRAKQNIVLFNPAVVKGNIASNTIQLVMRGVRPDEAIEGQYRSAKSVAAWHQDKAKLADLQTRLRIGRKRFTAKTVKKYEAHIAQLNSSIASNPISKLIEDHYLYDSVVEDLDSQKDISEVLGELIDRTGKSIPKNGLVSKAKKAQDIATIAPTTKVGQGARYVAQYSDLIARHVLYKHLLETTDLTKDEVAQKVIDGFINYNTVDAPTVRWLNDNGLLWFSKYLLGFQRVIAGMLKTQAATTIGYGMAAKAFDISNPMNEIATPDKIMNKFSTDNVSEAFNLNALNVFDVLD